MKLISDLPDRYKDQLDHLHSVFDGVSGHNVKNETQLLDPPAWLRSPREKLGKRSPSSQNAAREVESALRTRQDFFCRGQPCTTSDACRFLGCIGCTFIDGILPGGLGVCI